jgi:hypothetical protein
VDEIIFPRQLLANPVAQLDAARELTSRGQVANKCEHYSNLSSMRNVSSSAVATRLPNRTTRYSMIDYIDSLASMYGGGAHVAVFDFRDFLVLERVDYMFHKILHDKFTLLNGSSETEEKMIKTLEYVNEKQQTSVRYHLGRQDKNSSFAEYLHSFKQLHGVIKCLNETVLTSTSRLMSRWRNPLVTLINNRPGKAICNTDFVYSLNPHTANEVRKGAVKQRVDVAAGFVSHFRPMDTSTQFRNEGKFMTMDIDMLKVDIEYFLFLVNNYKLFL